jgi:hypothetical protein
MVEIQKLLPVSNFFRKSSAAGDFKFRAALFNCFDLSTTFDSFLNTTKGPSPKLQPSLVEQQQTWK